MPLTSFLEVTPLKFNAIISAVAGFLFFGGWWIIVDVNVQYRNVLENAKVYHVPGILATFALIGVNFIPSDALYDKYATPGVCNSLMARLFLMAFLMASFGCFIAASYVLINDFLMDQSQYQWTGWGIFLQNLFILIACLLMRFGKMRDLL
ncbi:transmembrane protein 50A [Leptinotarsa decemlineata]|uniref:transmembrane protein 50A n=1 Tax=Leptinotarsa decemlineata TaxID=7539 RepID=UPI003D309C35